LKKKQNTKDPRVCIYMTPEEKQRVDTYLLAIMTKKGEVVEGLKALMLHKALVEWLDKHEKDLTALD
jgi:hypothetical protein